ncbi:hypothetical protein AGR2A_pa30017 [Agrobacterium genomosp. 2 str. CFBP 5494]|uniref:Uncharacterized protein n=1 Tax=Agrobacterium genomosp. 2 str. CFBP 5494 TaxID=1183436 RepID=A0A9W5B6I3_9HYPH|nr:hypothetical protein AGR2A_pa30017 [Agrobacterium genomosp. 2 str. CFBP 5494]
MGCVVDQQTRPNPLALEEIRTVDRPIFRTSGHEFCQKTITAGQLMSVRTLGALRPLSLQYLNTPNDTAALPAHPVEGLHAIWFHLPTNQAGPRFCWMHL